MDIIKKCFKLNKLTNIYLSKKLLNKFPKKLRLTKYKQIKSTKIDFKYLENDFTSKNVANNIKKRCNYQVVLQNNYRTIKIIGNNSEIPYIKKIIKDIDMILNFFDDLLGMKNNYNLYFYLSDLKKKIDKKNKVIGIDEINSGLTSVGIVSVLFRKEEVVKVFIHELIHYLKLDIYDLQDKIKFIFDDINLDNKLLNPNEAYTEYLAIIILCYFQYLKSKTKMSRDEFMSKRLLVELQWSFYQIAKILDFFKCYNSYEDLFTKKCKFRQRTSVLSYFILKAYFLFYSDKFMDCINFDSIENRFNCVRKINLQDKKFGNCVNVLLNFYRGKFDNCMRMSFPFNN